MAEQVVWPTLYESNDMKLTAALTTNQPTAGTALDLTGATLQAYLKASAATSDSDPGVWNGSSSTGEITVTSAATGDIEIAIPRANVNTTKGWLRVDVVDAGGLVKTAVYGSVTVVDL